VALLRCLLISYGPPHYGMGYALCQLLGGCAPWPGEKRWVLICFASVCVGYGLRRHPCCPQLGCGSGPSSDVGGWSPAAGATAEEVILPLWGGVYGGSMPSGDCPVLCGGFRSGDLPSAIRWLATVCAGPGGGGLDFFTARKGDAVLEYLWVSACICPPEGGPEAFGCVIMGNA
jgi:hypothetical protein